MKGKRRKFSAAFKAKVAIEALKERESLAELSRHFEVHANMISKWMIIPGKQRHSSASSSAT
jgi:transposase